MRFWRSLCLLTVAVLYALACPRAGATDVPLGGYIPLVGFGLTDEYATFNDSATPSVALPSFSPEGSFLESGSPYFDIGLLDTGAAVHILTHEADLGFDISGNGYAGTNTQTVGGATGLITLDINDALSIYAAGLADRIPGGTELAMNTSVMRGQTSVAILSAPTEWQLPNIIGLPMAAHHAIAIHNDLPQIFEHRDRTVRTPQIDFLNLGVGGSGHGVGGGDILRRAQLELRPGISFIQGPIYTPNLLDIFNGHDNPMSPSVVENAALFIDVDLTNDGQSLQDTGFLFDTGADLTVVSEQTAVRLGFDPILDTPDFLLEVEGSGGVIEGIPGFYVDELNLDTVGGSFTLTNVPVAVLDVTNPNDPGNIIPGILGTHLFVDRNLVIDANPSIGQGGAGPSLYISDPITQSHAWATTAASGNWQTASHWNASGTPDDLWVANVANVSGSDQRAVVVTDSQVFQVNIDGSGGARMDVRVQSGATLLVFGGVTIAEDAGLVIAGGGKVDAQFIQLDDGGMLSGDGDIFVGAGPIGGQVRNASGIVAPGDADGAMIGRLTIEGDFSNRLNGTLAVDLGGTTAGSQFDQLILDGAAFLGGLLDVSFVDLGGGLFAPESGDMFEILTATDGVSGQFATLQLPVTARWDIHYDVNSVTLEVLSLTNGLPADFNGDGTVDDADFAVWQSSFGTSTGASHPQGDVDADGDVDGVDFLTWQQSFGAGAAGTGSSQSAVPEPGAVALAGFLLTCLWFGKKRQPTTGGSVRPRQ